MGGITFITFTNGLGRAGEGQQELLSILGFCSEVVRASYPPSLQIVLDLYFDSTRVTMYPYNSSSGGKLDLTTIFA
jgi:hypothetical protein